MTAYSSSGFSFPASNFKESDKLLLHFTPTVGADLVVLAHSLSFPACSRSAGNHRRSFNNVIFIYSL